VKRFGGKRLFIWPLVCLLSACGPASAPRAAAAGEARPAYLPPVNADLDDAARFLAGLPGREQSAWKALEEEEAWQQHARDLKQLWSRFEEQRLPAMTGFRARELTQAGATVFYPFSGADALTVLTLFPEHQEYFLAALEPPGTVPERGEFTPERLGAQLPALDSTLYSILSKSFFVTREMDRQLRGQVTDGVCELLFILLARSGHHILAAGYVQLDAEGRIQTRPTPQQGSAFNHNLGLVIEFQKENRAPQRLYYFSLNLHDRHLSSNQPFLEFAARLPQPATMLKSTSYLLHDKGFSKIREVILDRSAVIVQDDSGVPYRYLTPERWNVQLYGDYSLPFRPFQFRVQSDLRAAYQQKAAIRALGFPIGYGAGRIPSNLLVARRKS
jgi:hypothetical protein